MVALLNPGRSGVDRTVIRTLRTIPLLSSVVYISCEPENPQVMAPAVGTCYNSGAGIQQPGGPGQNRELVGGRENRAWQPFQSEGVCASGHGTSNSSL